MAKQPGGIRSESNRLSRHPAFHYNPADMAEAHSFTWNGTGQSLLEAKLTAIAAAQSSVVMETFIFRDSDIGERFRDALTAAARRGVRVRLIVDAIGSFGLGRNYFDELMAAGGAMRWFNELRLARTGSPDPVSRPRRSGSLARRSGQAYQRSWWTSSARGRRPPGRFGAVSTWGWRDSPGTG